MIAPRAARVASLVVAATLFAACASTPASHDEFTRLPGAARADAARQVVVTIDDARAPRLVARPGSTPRALGGGGAYRGSAYAQDVARALARDYELEWVAAWRIEVLGVHCVVFRIPPTMVRDSLLQRLRSDRRVETAQPMQSFSTGARPSPDAGPVTAPPPPQSQRAATASNATGMDAARWDDPYFPLQRALQAMRVPEAQSLATGRAVRVAVIDTGVDLAHPDLAAQVDHAVNFVDADAARFRADRHGTAVAGAIAALGNNRIGIVGVAPGVRLLLLKACWEDDPSRPATCNSLTLAEALAHAIERRAQVINLSLTGPADPLLERLLRRALRAGIVVVGADLAPGVDGVASFPLGVTEVLAVRDSDDPGDGAEDVVPRGRAIAVPGRAVLTTVPGGHYDYVSGTSMAVALASGVVALALQLQPRLDGARLGHALRDGAGVPLDAVVALRSLATVGSAVRSSRAVAGTLPCDSAGRSAECR